MFFNSGLAETNEQLSEAKIESIVINNVKYVGKAK